MAATKVWTTATICEEISHRYNLENINQLAHKFGVTYNSARNWSRGGTLDAEQIRTAAALLDEDPEWIALCLAPERLRDANLADVMRTWLMQHGTAAAVLGAAISGVFVLAALPASAFAGAGLCILCSIADTGRRCLRRLIARSMLAFPDLPPVALYRPA